MKRVVTWQSPRGIKINICKECEKKLEGKWPKDWSGEEFCTVYKGIHNGRCDICEAYDRGPRQEVREDGSYSKDDR